MILPVPPVHTVKTAADVLRPMFSRGDLPVTVRLRRAWAKWQAGDVFTWCDVARGFLTPDERYVVRADTIRGAPDLFEPEPVQMELGGLRA